MSTSPDAAELRRVYRTHVRTVYAFLAYSADAHTAEDLTSATFERVLRAWTTFDPTLASEKTWILTIARNILTDHFRRQSLRHTTSTEEHPEILDRLTGPRDALAGRIAVDGAKDWLAQLSPREQEIVALRYGADLQGSDIAELTGLTTDNIHQILSRALRKLRAAADQGDVSRSA